MKINQTGENRASGGIARLSGEALRDLPEMFEITDDGHLGPADIAELKFRFEFSGVLFHATARRAEDGGWLSLSGDLGPLPFSSEAPEIRATLRELVQGLDGTAGLRCRLSNRQHMLLEGEEPVGLPLAPSDLLTSATLFVLRARQILGRLAAPLALVTTEPATPDTTWPATPDTTWPATLAD